MINRALIGLFLTALSLVGCHRSEISDPNARYYNVRGLIRGVAPSGDTLDIEHEDIPGFMPSMTMPFTVRNHADVAGLKVGDAIAFRMVVTDKALFLDRVTKIEANDVHLPARTPAPSPAVSRNSRLKEGDPLPAFSLTDQDGKAITNETFRGEPVVITFIFTRCPVPNFCPRMSNNFVELQNAIQAGEKARLLSITLDPQYDTPAVLKQYAESHRADSAIWTFATGHVDALLSAFSVFRQEEGGTISHGLATALVSPDGRILKIWRGNAWTPQEVIEALRSAGE
jgi:protein SCO1/2